MGLRPCIRRYVPLLRLRLPFSRQIHTTIPCQARSEYSQFADEQEILADQLDSTDDEGASHRPDYHLNAQTHYAAEVNKRSMRRWRESQEPKGKLQFMT